jgi:hypothetical protein
MMPGLLALGPCVPYVVDFANWTCQVTVTEVASVLGGSDGSFLELLQEAIESGRREVVHTYRRHACGRLLQGFQIEMVGVSISSSCSLSPPHLPMELP